MKRSQLPMIVIAGLAAGVAIGAEMMRPAYLMLSDAQQPTPQPMTEQTVPVRVPVANVRPDVLYTPTLLSGERGGPRWAVAQIPMDPYEPAAQPKPVTKNPAPTKVVAQKPVPIKFAHKPVAVKVARKTIATRVAGKPVPKQIAHTGVIVHRRIEFAAITQAPNTVTSAKHLTFKQKINKLWVGLKSKFNKHKSPTA